MDFIGAGKERRLLSQVEEIAVIADLIREAVARSEIASMSDTERAARAVLSLYRTDIRNSVLRKTSIIGCIREIWPAVEMLLRPGEETIPDRADATKDHAERGKQLYSVSCFSYRVPSALFCLWSVRTAESLRQQYATSAWALLGSCLLALPLLKSNKLLKQAQQAAALSELERSNDHGTSG